MQCDANFAKSWGLACDWEHCFALTGYHHMARGMI